jgi:hypothetical protein
VQPLIRDNTAPTIVARAMLRILFAFIDQMLHLTGDEGFLNYRSRAYQI